MQKGNSEEFSQFEPKYKLKWENQSGLFPDSNSNSNLILVLNIVLSYKRDYFRESDDETNSDVPVYGDDSRIDGSECDLQREVPCNN